MDVRGVSEGGASIPVPPRRGTPSPPALRGAPPRRALHATLRVKHFAGFVDGRGGRWTDGKTRGRRDPTGGRGGRRLGAGRAARGEGSYERRRGFGWEDNSIPVN